MARTRKHTPEILAGIRELYFAGEATTADLAKRYGVSRGTIYRWIDLASAPLQGWVDPRT